MEWRSNIRSEWNGSLTSISRGEKKIVSFSYWKTGIIFVSCNASNIHKRIHNSFDFDTRALNSIRRTFAHEMNTNERFFFWFCFSSKL